jgi:flagellar assembly factor FliW
MSAAESQTVIAFPDGLPGYETCRRFLLMTPPALAPFTVVQHADGPLPAFMAIDPARVRTDYRAELSQADRDRLSASPDAPLVWLAVVSPTPGGKPTVDLEAPIVINPATKTGVQISAPPSA